MPARPVPKCGRCRSDKQKCQPEKREWPVEICDRCRRFGYTCSAPTLPSHPLSHSLGDNQSARELLRGAGFDITAGNSDNVQAINWAIENKHRACVRLLLENYMITPGLANHVYKALAKAAASAQVETVRLLLESGADANGHDPEDIPIDWAIMTGNQEMVRLFLDHGADVKSSHGDSRVSTMHFAVPSGDVTIAQWLIDAGASCQIADDEGRLPLHEAVGFGHLDLVRLFLDHGCNPNARDNDGFTPLHTAAQQDRALIAAYLIERGADIDALEALGGSPLKIAAFTRNPEVVSCLLGKGASLNDGFALPLLHSAVSLTTEQFLSFFKDRPWFARMDEEAQAKYKYWKCHMAHESTVRLILDREKSLLYSKDERGNSFLHLAASRGYEGVVRLGLDEGADVCALGESRKTLLHFAADNGHKEVAKLLLERHADIEARETEFGRTALHMAAENGHEEVLELLLAWHAKTSASGGLYGTALQSAVAEGHSKAALALLDHGADVNGRGGVYGTALQTAAWKNNEELLKVLLDRGADVGIRGGEHGSALEAARAAGHQNIIQVLQTISPSGTNGICDSERADVSFGQLLTSSIDLQVPDVQPDFVDLLEGWGRSS